MLMIVLAMLTGFNKIGLLERGTARDRVVVCFLHMYHNVSIPRT